MKNNNNIVVIIHDDFVTYRYITDSYKKGEDKIKEHYLKNCGWDLEDWDDDEDFKNAEEVFNKCGYVEFCDGDHITTLEEYYKNEFVRI